jgi:predicted dithiol-disulfide oxidoreductase (DUF899 family)
VDRGAQALLAEEKQFSRLRDGLCRRRRELPWERVEKEYVFEGPDGRETLAELFDGRSQLVVYHFMFGPEDDVGRKSCSFWADNFDPNVVHLNARDLTFVAVSRGPLSKLTAYRERMGWGFKWVSSSETDFNFDYGVSFTPEDRERPVYNYGSLSPRIPEREGMSVFFKDESGDVFHTYSSDARGSISSMRPTTTSTSFRRGAMRTAGVSSGFAATTRTVAELDFGRSDNDRVGAAIAQAAARRHRVSPKAALALPPSRKGAEMADADALGVVQQYKEAFGRGDVETARSLLADDLHFAGPIDEFHRADDYVQSLAKLGQIVTGTDVKKVLADRNDVVTIYDLHTNTPAGTSTIAEWATVRDGKIAELRAYFDARPFAAMFGQG